jgi:hypothetical protein
MRREFIKLKIFSLRFKEEKLNKSITFLNSLSEPEIKAIFFNLNKETENKSIIIS